MEHEKRLYPRREVDYLAELWVPEEKKGPNVHDSYKDIGFRGTVKDISEGGASVHNFINLNLMGLEPNDVLTKRGMVKLVMHTQGDRIELEGWLVWLNSFVGKECLGICFTNRTQ